jgi:hypothetical protein
MKRFFVIPLVLTILLIPAAVVLASSGEGSFDGVVSSIEARYHVRATRIPFMVLVSLISRKATNGGVGSIRVAEIENFSAAVDGDELNKMVEEKLGQGWERIIRDTSRNGHEQTLIFAHPEGARMGLFIVDKDGNEMDLVEVSVDPDHLDDDIGRYRHPHHDSDEGHGEDAGASN